MTLGWNVWQAVEYLAEWSLTPSNVAFLRVQTGVSDPVLIGDKVKWFAHELDIIRFSSWDDSSSLVSALRALSTIHTQPTGSHTPDSSPVAKIYYSHDFPIYHSKYN